MRARTLLISLVTAALVTPVVAIAPPVAAASTTVGQQLVQLVADDLGPSFNGFRTAIDADGSVVASGASGEDIGANYDQGAAYISTEDGSGWSSQKLTGAQANDEFGFAVALDAAGTVLAVSAPGENSDTGAVYVYTSSASGWTLQQRLVGDDSAVSDGLGYSLAMTADGTTLVATAIDHEHATMPEECDSGCYGGAYVFHFNGTTWQQQAEVLPTSEAYAWLGGSVAVDGDGDTLLLGSGGWDNGEAFLFRDTASGWTELQRFQSDDLVNGWLAGGDNDVA